MPGYQQISNDLKELLELLLAHRVEFVLVGAHAVAVHGRPRFTEALDVMIRRSRENASRLAGALAEFGTPSPEASVELLATDARAMITLGVKPFQVEILNFADGIEFDSVRPRAENHDLRGVRIPVLSLEDLVRNKRTANRPKDQFDLAMLREIHGALPGDEAE